MSRARCALIAAVAVAMSALAPTRASTEDDYRISETVFVGEARGPYHTGTEEELWIDDQRLDTTTLAAADKRHLLIQLWYPATLRDGAQRAPYILNPGLYSEELQQRFARHRHVQAAGTSRPIMQIRTGPIAEDAEGAGIREVEV